MSSDRPLVSIDFFADLTCPWCYVAWGAMKKAATESPAVTCNMRWRAFLLYPQMPTGGIGRAEFYSKANGFDPEQLALVRPALQEAAAEAQVTLNLDAPHHLPSTLDAHRLIHWAAAAGEGEAAIDALFEAYWIHGQDIGDQAILATLAKQIGFDPAQAKALFETIADIDVIQDQHRAAMQVGLKGVPAAVFNNKAILMGAESSQAYAKAIADFAEAPAAPPMF